MKEKGFPLPHRVLIVAEKRQRVLDEMGECRQCFLARHRPVELVQRAEMSGEFALDERHHLAACFIGRKAPSLRRRQFLWQRLPVVAVEIPFAARGLVAFHQEARLAPQLPVEKLHAEALASFRPFVKALMAGEEAVIVAYVEHTIMRLPPCVECGAQTPFAGLRHHGSLRLVSFKRAFKFADERPGIAGVVQLHVVDLDPFLF